MDLREELATLESEGQKASKNLERAVQAQREARDLCLRLEGAIMQMRDLVKKSEPPEAAEAAKEEK